MPQEAGFLRKIAFWAALAIVAVLAVFGVRVLAAKIPFRPLQQFAAAL